MIKSDRPGNRCSVLWHAISGDCGMPFLARPEETPEAYLSDFNTPEALFGPRLRDPETPDTPQTLSGPRLRDL